MSLPKAVELREVGPREGFQFEGIGRPDLISLADKADLIERLASSGLSRIEIASFVSPKLVPQMADAERLCAAVGARSDIELTGIYLNDRGLERALAATGLTVHGNVMLTASETFSFRNQKRRLEDDIAMQRRIARIYADSGIALDTGTIMAAFGCNWEGAIPLERIMSLIDIIEGMLVEYGGSLRELCLADTMGWGHPGLIRSVIAAARRRLPEVRIVLHLHDTRGLAIANVYSALLEGVDCFDAAVGGLGGCPFAGHRNAAGNVSTEEIVFLCEELGIATGVALDRLIECADRAESLVGHPLPRKIRTVPR